MAFFGITISELVLLAIIAAMVIAALKILLTKKPLQIGWLIFIIIAPPMAAFCYLMYQLGYFVSRQKRKMLPNSTPTSNQ